MVGGSAFQLFLIFAAAVSAVRYPVAGEHQGSRPDEAFVCTRFAAVSHWPFNQPGDGQGRVSSRCVRSAFKRYSVDCFGRYSSQSGVSRLLFEPRRGCIEWAHAISGAGWWCRLRIEGGREADFRLWEAWIPMATLNSQRWACLEACCSSRIAKHLFLSL